MADYYLFGLLLFTLIHVYTASAGRSVRQAEVTTTVAPLANVSVLAGNTSEPNASHAITVAQPTTTPTNESISKNASDSTSQITTISSSNATTGAGNSSEVNLNQTTTSAPVNPTSTVESADQLTTGLPAVTPAVNATVTSGSGASDVTTGKSSSSNTTVSPSTKPSAESANPQSSTRDRSKQSDTSTTPKSVSAAQPSVKREGKKAELMAAASDNVATSVAKPGPAEDAVPAPIQYPNADYESKAAPPPQNPDLLSALKVLRGSAAASAKSVDMAEMLASAVAGKDYPNLSEIPDPKSFACKNVQQAGFYADVDTDCQVIRRCDINGNLWSYLCPNLTRFNQIELICDWFWNVDCSQAKQFYDFSNSRLYHASWVFLDTPPNVDNDGKQTSVIAGDKKTAQADAKGSKLEKTSPK